MELLGSILAQLGINKTFFFQLVLVVISSYFLNKFVFKRVLATLVLRDDKVSGARKDAHNILFEYDNLKKEYNSKWVIYEQEAEQIKKASYQEARSKASALIKKSKSESESLLLKKREETNSIVGVERNELLKESNSLIKDISNKIIDKAM